MTETECSDHTSIPIKTLRDWRYRKVHIPYSRIGALVRYSETEVDAYLHAQTVEVRRP
jgi:hypothetical protein